MLSPLIAKMITASVPSPTNKDTSAALSSRTRAGSQLAHQDRERPRPVTAKRVRADLLQATVRLGAGETVAAGGQGAEDNIGGHRGCRTQL